MNHLLFYSRLVLYFILVTVIALHPAVAVAYDAVARWTYFVLIPASLLLAYYIKPPRFKIWTGPVILLLLLLFTMIIVTGIGRMGLLIATFSVSAFILTFLIFRSQGRGLTIASFELFLHGAIYYRLLEFSRSSEEIALKSEGITTIVIMISIVAFLFHGIVLYLSAFPDRSIKRKRSEGIAFAAIILPLALFLAFVLPSDFIRHDMVFNYLNEEPPPTPEGLGQGEEQEGEPSEHNRDGRPLGDRDERYPSELQGGRGRGQGEAEEGEEQEGEGQGIPGGQGSRSGEDNRLEGVPSDQWDNMQQSGGGEGKQMAVMIIASEIQPVYAAEKYLGEWDLTEGFTESTDEALNDLTDRRLIESWRDPEPRRDSRRTPFDIYYLSTIEQRVLAYRPFSVQPTVLNRRYHPFNLSYTAASAISISGPEDWEMVTELSPAQTRELEKYLEVDLPAETERRIQRLVDERITDTTGYFDRIQSLIEGMSVYQYEMGFDESNVAHIEQFLFETGTGDCVEFAHSLALMGRMAGIPSRVVNGYLASLDLQTPAHRGGIRELRGKIPELKEFPEEELYLVTTSHRHAWVQFYLPEYGWIDFESTAFAIPPEPEGDPNSMDVIIPMLEPEEYESRPGFVFPWRFVGQALGLAILAALIALYLYRFIHQGILSFKARKMSPEGIRALLTLFFIRLSEEGFPVKKKYMTAVEYAEEHEPVRELAALYTRLYYKLSWTEEDKKKAWQSYKSLYKKTLKDVRQPGVKAMLRRIFSLKGLYY